MKKTISILGLLLLTSSSLFAQQESIITFYKNHLNLVNPAFVGADQATSIQSTIRKQWAGVKDAPETQAVSFMMPFENKKFALGVSFVRDRVFIEKQTFAAIDFSYDVKLTDKLNLFMGIKAGVNNYEVNTSGLQSYNVQYDPSLESFSRFNPNIGVGFYLKHEKYYLSLSTPKMLNSERARNQDGFASVATDKAHFYLSSGYNLELSQTLDLMPSVMIRYVNGAPFSTDFTANTIFNKKIDVGVTYRTNQTAAGMVKFVVNPNIEAGFAYEYIMESQLLARANNSNEFFIKYKF